jgi:hypothetical protein
MKKIILYFLVALTLTSCSKSDNSNSNNYKNEVLGNYTNPEQPWSIFVSNSPSGLHTINATSDPAKFDFIFNLTFDSVQVSPDYSFVINEYGVDKKSNLSYKTTGSGTFKKDGVAGRMYIIYTISPSNSKAFATFTKQ